MTPARRARQAGYRPDCGDRQPDRTASRMPRAAARWASIASALLDRLPVRWDPRHSGARERYFLLDGQAGKLMRNLCREDNPGRRAVLLDRLAEAEAASADIYRQAFGPDPIASEDGRDMAESHASAAQLVRFAAACEHELAGSRALDVFPDDPAAPWPAAYCMTLVLLRGERDRAERARLLDEFYEDVVDDAGGQAAEVLVSLAYAERQTARRTS